MINETAEHRLERNRKRGEYYKKNPSIYLNLVEWRKRNRNKYLATMNRSCKKLRIVCLEYYGGTPPKCSCCNEHRIEFLALDHLDGKGAEHRRKIGSGYKIYYWLKKNNFPVGFRVLCHNCNLSYGFYGYCPHIKEK